VSGFSRTAAIITSTDANCSRQGHGLYLWYRSSEES
jgi:hypothetical protein